MLGFGALAETALAEIPLIPASAPVTVVQGGGGKKKRPAPAGPPIWEAERLRQREAVAATLTPPREVLPALLTARLAEDGDYSESAVIALGPLNIKAVLDEPGDSVVASAFGYAPRVARFRHQDINDEVRSHGKVLANDDEEALGLLLDD